MAVLLENRFKLSHIPCFNMITVSLIKLHEISVVTEQKRDAFPIAGGNTRRWSIATLEICAGVYMLSSEIHYF